MAPITWKGTPGVPFQLMALGAREVFRVYFFGISGNNKYDACLPPVKRVLVPVL